MDGLEALGYIRRGAAKVPEPADLTPVITPAYTPALREGSWFPFLAAPSQRFQDRSVWYPRSCREEPVWYRLFAFAQVGIFSLAARRNQSGRFWQLGFSSCQSPEAWSPPPTMEDGHGPIPRHHRVSHSLAQGSTPVIAPCGNLGPHRGVSDALRRHRSTATTQRHAATATKHRASTKHGGKA